MSFAHHLAEDRRLRILQLLQDAAGYSSNDSLLLAALEGFGHRIGHDLLRGDLAWLEEQGLATVEDLAGIVVAKLTERGLDVATGRARHPGVKRPAP